MVCAIEKAPAIAETGLVVSLHGRPGKIWFVCEFELITVEYDQPHDGVSHETTTARAFRSQDGRRVIHPRPKYFAS